MSTIIVQCTDDTEKTVVSYFASPQDPGVYPNQITIETSDPRWASYVAEQPTMVQRILPSAS
ncbi:hypothetical protein C3Z06_06875 [Cupriavidus metallidurans]|nr:hypothetical protein C3Z06_06875 [Cupriavidus metallidurans]